MTRSTILLAAFLSLLGACNTEAQRGSRNSDRVGGYCEGCEGIYEGMPKNLSWRTALADSAELGELLEITGTIFKKDGKTPAKNIILYVYHTNAKGYYEPTEKQTGWARRHGHLRGWVKTDEKGRYAFRSIRPAPYPNGSDPAHIHCIIKEPDKNEYWIDDYFFEGDLLITERTKNRLEKRGGSGIVKLTKDENGVWTGQRDIVLGLNVPNYK
ncbi:MAG: intradiol ring-cleavage dioxygenase [candidate division Zixibacteria bacterium]|nr:intradiol ring-cleavage dioxygenase [candidate division Zixibacteria bacterium]MCI0595144.1 intradiol ring-cleavage dioxygenase [candidate division Zixibacteria bacterium]